MDSVANILSNYEQRAVPDKTVKKRQSNTLEKGRTEQNNDTPTYKISLSDTFRAIKIAQQALASDAFDPYRIDRNEQTAQLKSAVEEGRYQVDFDRIAGKMLNSIYDNLE